MKKTVARLASSMTIYFIAYAATRYLSHDATFLVAWIAGGLAMGVLRLIREA